MDGGTETGVPVGGGGESGVADMAAGSHSTDRQTGEQGKQHTTGAGGRFTISDVGSTDVHNGVNSVHFNSSYNPKYFETYLKCLKEFMSVILQLYKSEDSVVWICAFTDIPFWYLMRAKNNVRFSVTQQSEVMDLVNNFIISLQNYVSVMTRIRIAPTTSGFPEVTKNPKNFSRRLSVMAYAIGSLTMALPEGKGWTIQPFSQYSPPKK